MATEGRPTKYSLEVVAPVLRDISNGVSAVRACRAHGIPWSTWTGWLREIPEFSDKYAQAKESCMDFMFEETLEIADGLVDQRDVAAARLQVETRFTICERQMPKKYGKRTTTELVGDPARPISLNVSKLSDDELAIARNLAQKLAESGDD